jgi:hypothetical protein
MQTTAQAGVAYPTGGDMLGKSLGQNVVFGGKDKSLSFNVFKNLTVNLNAFKKKQGVVVKKPNLFIPELLPPLPLLTASKETVFFTKPKIVWEQVPITFTKYNVIFKQPGMCIPGVQFVLVEPVSFTCPVGAVFRDVNGAIRCIQSSCVGMNKEKHGFDFFKGMCNSFIVSPIIECPTGCYKDFRAFGRYCACPGSISACPAIFPIACPCPSYTVCVADSYWCPSYCSHSGTWYFDKILKKFKSCPDGGLGGIVVGGGVAGATVNAGVLGAAPTVVPVPGVPVGMATPTAAVQAMNGGGGQMVSAQFGGGSLQGGQFAVQPIAGSSGGYVAGGATADPSMSFGAGGASTLPTVPIGGGATVPGQAVAFPQGKRRR